MLRVGLTGGIATGKSTVSHMFVECGAHLIDADLLAREAVAPGRPALREIVASFGPGMLAADGTLNRDRLAGIVFKDPTQRARLEAIIHPYVFAEEERRCLEIGEKDPHTVVLFDAALLIVHSGSWSIPVVTDDEPWSPWLSVTLAVLTRLVPASRSAWVTMWLPSRTSLCPTAKVEDPPVRVTNPSVTLTPVRSMLPVLVTTTV